jgi:hypothetical protein
MIFAFIPDPNIKRKIGKSVTQDEALLPTKTANFTWTTTGFGSVMETHFMNENRSTCDVKDVLIEFTVYGISGPPLEPIQNNLRGGEGKE